MPLPAQLSFLRVAQRPQGTGASQVVCRVFSLVFMVNIAEHWP